MMRPANQDEIARWDELVVRNPDGGNALQTKAWGEFKSRWGWLPQHLVYELGDGRQVAVQWLVRKVPGQGKIWYCPKGPGVTKPEDYLKLVELTRSANWGGILARFESEVLDDDVPDKVMLLRAGLARANRDPGSKSTIFVDLSAGEEIALASFNQTARRNIRKAMAAGVSVEPVDPTEANLEVMFELMRVTEARALFGLRSKAYFWDYWRSQIAAGQAQLFFARHEGEVLAGVFATYLGKRAWYKDGGSFDHKRELQPSYLMQWEVMCWLMEHGVEQYDMMGSPNRDQVDAENSRAGLYEFKRKFNPEITEFIGCWDLPLAGAGKYKMWLKLGERIAAKMANRRPERFLY